MTNKEAKEKLYMEWQKFLEDNIDYAGISEAYKTAFKALEQEPYDFAKWVATEIFDDMWEYNKDAFAEIACRKLEKLGIVRAKGDEWELVDTHESDEQA